MSQMVKKATGFEIINHWLLAISCLILIVTGFGFLYQLEQMNTVFGSFNLMKGIHNWAGVVFVISLLATILNYLPVSLKLGADDIKWFLKGGGYIKKNVSLPPQDIINSGQKLYYLTVLASGLAISASGFIIWLLPASKLMVQISHLLHNMSFVIMVVAIPVHIYLATIANPGAFRIMVYGTVPLGWAKKRHGKWVSKLGY